MKWRLAVGVLIWFGLFIVGVQASASTLHVTLPTHVGLGQEIQPTEAAVSTQEAADPLAGKFSLATTSLDIIINGFISAGFGKTDVDKVQSLLNPLEYIEPRFRCLRDKVSFEPYTLVGIQFEAPISQDLSVVTQFIGRGLDQFDIEANWAYLRYQYNPFVIIQVGRIRLPTFLFSDTIDVGYSYPWIAPPAEVYDQIPIPNANGAQMIVNFDLGEVEFEFQPFYGSSKPHYVSFDDFPIEASNVIGAEISATYDFITLRASKLVAEISLTFPTDLIVTLPSVKDKHTEFWGVGAQVDWKHLRVLAEYTERNVSGYLPDTKSWYVLGGCQIGRFLPYVTYSELRTTDKSKRNLTGNPLLDGAFHALLDTDQDSIEVGLRFDVTDSVALKLSGQHIKPRGGTKGVFSEIPSGSVDVVNAAVQAVY